VIRAQETLEILLEVPVANVIGNPLGEPAFAFAAVILDDVGQFVNDHSIVIGSFFRDRFRRDVNRVVAGARDAFHRLENQ
jgi:hypothetical protein